MSARIRAEPLIKHDLNARCFPHRAQRKEAALMRGKKRRPEIDARCCAACGECAETCPRLAITIPRGLHASVDRSRCAGCGLCASACPASAIRMEEVR